MNIQVQISINDASRHEALVAEQAKLYVAQINTQLGPLVALADHTALYRLAFVDCHGIEQEIERLEQKVQQVIVPGRTKIIDLIEQEVKQYFDGNLQIFTTPIKLIGSSFQQLVWHELQRISYGTTRSYTQLAISVEKPLACRAVAQANSANQLAIVIPCHRVINANGTIGGYNGGISRKKWLLKHEKGQ